MANAQGIAVSFKSRKSCSAIIIGSVTITSRTQFDRAPPRYGESSVVSGIRTTNNTNTAYTATGEFGNRLYRRGCHGHQCHGSPTNGTAGGLDTQRIDCLQHCHARHRLDAVMLYNSTQQQQGHWCLHFGSQTVYGRNFTLTCPRILPVSAHPARVEKFGQGKEMAVTAASLGAIATIFQW